MFGKLIDGNLIEAPKMLHAENTIIYNPPAKMYREHGWKEVIANEDEPPEGYYFVDSWVEKETTIELRREVVPLPDEISDDEAFEIIFGGGE